jgi:disulfide bond formation protein DsbB
MADKIAGLISNFISVAAFIFAIAFLQRKSASNPDLKLFGLSMKTVNFLLFLGLGISLALLVVGFIA